MCDIAHQMGSVLDLSCTDYYGQTLASRMASASINAFDDSIVHSLNGLVGRWPIFDRAMAFVSMNALCQGALFISIFWYYWFRQADTANRKVTREHLLCTIAGGMFAIVIARALAVALPFRMRPRFEPSLHFVLPQGLDPGNFWDWSAFPSDHAVMFAALATGLVFISWRAGLLSYLYISVIVLFPRLYLGIHYPTDLLAGAALGALCGVCVNLAPVRARISGWALTLENDSPGAFYVAMFIATFLFATMFDSLREGAQSAWHLVAQLTGGHTGPVVEHMVRK
jgi:undecaprenyl-diphosphatase